MTSMIAFVQITAILTAAILVGIYLVCNCKKSTLLKRYRSHLVMGKQASAPKAKSPVNPSAACHTGIICLENQKR